MIGKKGVLFLLLLSINAQAEDKKTTWINDLSCEKYTSYENCKKISKFPTSVDLTSYEKMTFDNQLKKITHLLHKGKEDIAASRYEMLFSALEDTLKPSGRIILNENKESFWIILVNYSKSEDYTPNPKYKM